MKILKSLQEHVLFVKNKSLTAWESALLSADNIENLWLQSNQQSADQPNEQPRQQPKVLLMTIRKRINNW